MLIIYSKQDNFKILKIKPECVRQSSSDKRQYEKHITLPKLTLLSIVS